MSEVLIWAQQFAQDNSTQALANLSGAYNRSTMSLYLNGKYPADVSAIEATLRPLMHKRQCPFLTREILATDCMQRQSRHNPTTKQAKCSPTGKPAKAAHIRQEPPHEKI